MVAPATEGEDWPAEAIGQECRWIDGHPTESSSRSVWTGRRLLRLSLREDRSALDGATYQETKEFSEERLGTVDNDLFGVEGKNLDTTGGSGLTLGPQNAQRIISTVILAVPFAYICAIS